MLVLLELKFISKIKGLNLKIKNSRNQYQKKYSSENNHRSKNRLLPLEAIQFGMRFGMNSFWYRV